MTGKVLRILKGHTESVSSLVFSPDGKKLVSGGTDSTVKIWDLETENEPLTMTRHTDGVMQVAFSSDGKIIFSASLDGTIKLWNFTQPIVLKTLQPKNTKILCALIGSSDQWIATG